MTLKSNKNEPAATLEPINSVRTALSDLYLEQLLQNKPKSEKAAMQTYESKGADLYSNGSAAHMNGPDLTKMREVAFEKNPSEPMGVTLKLNDKQRCTVARILHGGMIHRQGSLHEGDEITEINGQSVANHTVDHLQKILKETNGVVTMKVIPNLHSHSRACESLFFSRGHFYNSMRDKGAPGVGRRHIKSALLSKYPEKYVYPAPHTSRPQRKDEEGGQEYHFVSNDAMSKCISANELLEYGSFQGFMFGTKIETIQKIHERDAIALLDTEPQTLKLLRTAEFAPLVIFIAPTNAAARTTEALQLIQKESDAILATYGHFFDEILVNNDVDESVKGVEEAIERATSTPQWVPVSWVY